MSVVITIKDKDRFVIGADKQGTIGYSTDHNLTKIWRVADMPSIVMGGVGSARATQILQYNPLIDKNRLTREGITTDYIVNCLVPAIGDLLTKNGVPCGVPQDGFCAMSPVSLLIAFRDRAWRIGHDFSVIEIEKYDAAGAGADIATGVLYATKDLNPFDRIVMAIDAAADNNATVDHGVNFLVTKDEARDEEHIIKALEGEEGWLEYQAEIAKAEAEEKLKEKEAAKDEAKPAKKAKKPVKKSKKVEK